MQNGLEGVTLAGNTADADFLHPLTESYDRLSHYLLVNAYTTARPILLQVHFRGTRSYLFQSFFIESDQGAKKGVHQLLRLLVGRISQTRLSTTVGALPTCGCSPLNLRKIKIDMG
jgi:hypothetical protein